MHAKVELSHPVFAVIFQEVIVLCACECVCFVTVLASGIDYDAYFFPMVLQGMAINFHQWSWLVVTALRLAFVTGQPDEHSSFLLFQ